MLGATGASRRRKTFLFMVSLVLAGILAACAGGGELSAPVPTFFRQPTNNAIVPPTFPVLMGVQRFVVDPAGEVRKGAGHFHILIDTDFIPPGDVIPEDEQHLHFDDGSTEAEITLSPGPHVLRLQFADGTNHALQNENPNEIFVVVVEDAPPQSVRFVSPTDGALVPPSFEVVMAATGLVVELAQEVREDIGHLHMLVDIDFVPAGQVIPSPEGDSRYVHLQDGAKRATLSLSPGPHTLRLQFADGLDTAQKGDQFRDEIKVNVRFGQGAQQVMFVEPLDGATVPQTFTVKTAAIGFVIEPALPGPLIPGLIRDGAGHLHILVNEDFVIEAIPDDETHIHLDQGQLSTQLTLEPGTYTLRLQLASHNQQAFAGVQFRDEITITVK